MPNKENGDKHIYVQWGAGFLAALFALSFMFAKFFLPLLGAGSSVDPKTASEPCESPHSLREQIECAEKDLRPGILAFEPEREMDQGQAARVSIRISSEKSAEVGKRFKNGPPVLQEIRVGPLMKATLHDSSNDFVISRIGEEKKIIKAPYTEWAWDVTPLSGGNKTLVVSVYAELVLPNNDHEQYEAFTGSALIHVHTRPSYVVGKFVRENWQWLLGSPILLGLIGWLWARIRKEKPRQAGFKPR